MQFVIHPSQIDWFNAKANNYPWENQPVINGFLFDWALGFERVRTEYDKVKDMWKTENAINQLRKEIKKMVENGHAKVPSDIGQIIDFGTFDADTVIEGIRNHEEADGDKANEKFPTFDYYHFQDQPYTEESEELDDFYGSIASCNFRFVAKGYLEKRFDNHIWAVVKQIGIYIRDGFDFVKTNPIFEQPLGFWSLKHKNVSKNINSKDSRLIDNASYRAYRADSGMGGDFYRYSDIKMIDVNHHFVYG
jgi:hypothetical protein